jgi:hypothetical protein
VLYILASRALFKPDSYRHEIQQLKDGVVDSLLVYSGASVPPLAVLVLRGVWDGV